MNEGGTALGFDFGLRRIGVAVGQVLAGGARPLRALAARSGEPSWTEVDALLEDWHPTALVVGLPYNVDGSAHGITAAAERFCGALESRYGLTVHRVDERYTSLEAGRALADRRRRGDKGRVRDGDVDAAAAAIILQGWLEETGGR